LGNDAKQKRATRALRYFAIFDGRNGYAVDVYPEELAAWRREYGKQIVGEFPTVGEAQAIAFARVQADCDARNARRNERLARARFK
jgi:hypothetical protein